MPYVLTRDGTRPTEMSKTGLFEGVLHSSNATRLPRASKPYEKFIRTPCKHKKIVPYGPTRDGTRPAEMGENTCLRRYFIVAQ